MAKRKPKFEVEEVLPNDKQLSERSLTWKKFMDTILAALNQTAVVKCTRHLQAVIGQRCRFCFTVIMHSLQAFRRWLILREHKRKHEPLPETDGPALQEVNSGEPERKYSKPNEENNFVLEKVCEMLDYDVSDDSNASDVQTDVEDEDNNFVANFNAADVKNQLANAVAKRKTGWAENGLMELMKAVENVPNMPGLTKVEKWLFNQNTGPFDIMRNEEVVVTEEKCMQYYHQQQFTVSRDADDTDSLATIDEKDYITKNRNDRNLTSRIIFTKCQIKTNSVKKFTSRPNVLSLSHFPIIQAEPKASSSSRHTVSRSDAAIETGEDLSQHRSHMAQIRKSFPACFPLPERDSRRKKVFKKTVKKKLGLKSPPKKGLPENSAKQYESALQRGGAVRKISTRHIHWQEMSFIAESSSDESGQVVVRNTRSKAKGTPRRIHRSSSRSSATPEASPRKKSPRRRTLSPRKTVDRELVGNFKSICLSPTKSNLTFRLEKEVSLPQQAIADQTTIMTDLFSRANEKISNSTTLGANTTTCSNRSVFPDATQGIVVYKPKAIQAESSGEERIRITAKDLELAQVSKSRHLESFKKFDHVIHPNSTVLFFPSDSEDDERFATQTTATTNTTTMTTMTTTDGDLSFDDDDPILTFKPRSSGRLNVMEYRNH